MGKSKVLVCLHTVVLRQFVCRGDDTDTQAWDNAMP